MSYQFELRLTALRKVMGITRSDMFKVAGTSYRKMNHVQFIRLSEFLESRIDGIPDLEELPGISQIKKLIEHQILLLTGDYHRPREWLVNHLTINRDWQSYASIVKAATRAGLSEDDLQAGSSRVKIQRRLVDGMRCWRLIDED